MKTLDELKAFCEGYKRALVSDGTSFTRSPTFSSDGTSITSTDDWVIWGGYDFNIAGADYIGPDITPKQLKVNAYQANWKGNLPDPVHTFII
jgi:hypothetical protein